jgi:uncharacterized RDD family membrane protein YckC
VAYIIDSIILGIVIFIIVLPFHGGFVTIGVVWIVLALLYFTLLDVYWGATIGKKLLGLSVQMENGGKVSITESFIRNISKFFILLPILDWLIAMVTSGNDRRQKFTDRIAKTTVVQTKKLVESATPSAPA